MKKTLFIAALIIASAGIVSAQSAEKVQYGIHITIGGRYDDLRMCVGSDAGVKGGPIMDIYFDVRFPAGDHGTLALNIPVMRPILFGAAFGMLQFEPQVTYEYRFGEGKSPHAVIGGGLGIVFHYGPDYTSSTENRGEDFFAIGPLLSGFAGIGFDTEKGYWMPGLKLFYSPLFSSDYPTGTVAGGALELHYAFN